MSSTEKQIPKTSSSQKPSHAIAITAIAISVIAIAGSTLSFYCGEKNKLQLNKAGMAAATTVQQLQSLQQNFLQLQNSEHRQLQNTLADVNYLVHFANLQLTLNNDIKTALKTLLLAQQQLASINNDAIFGLKQALSSDITTLQSTPAVDTQTLFSTVSTLEESIQNLSALPNQPTVSLQKTIEAIKSTSEKLPWYKRALDSFKSLKTLFVIRHLDHPSMPLISPEQELNLKQNIIMQFNMTQWAILHHDTATYQSTLQTVSQWISQFFPVSDSRTTILNQLTALQKMQIHPDMPTLSATLSALMNIKILPKAAAQSIQLPQNTAPNAPTIKIAPPKKPDAPLPASTQASVET